MSDYQELFLDLASRHEGLRVECPYLDFPGDCRTCNNSGWLPIPEKKRAGALIELLAPMGAFITDAPMGPDDVWHIILQPQENDPPCWRGDPWEFGEVSFGNTHNEALARAAVAAGL